MKVNLQAQLFANRLTFQAYHQVLSKPPELVSAKVPENSLTTPLRGEHSTIADRIIASNFKYSEQKELIKARLIDLIQTSKHSGISETNLPPKISDFINQELTIYLLTQVYPKYMKQPQVAETVRASLEGNTVQQDLVSPSLGFNAKPDAKHQLFDSVPDVSFTVAIENAISSIQESYPSIASNSELFESLRLGLYANYYLNSPNPSTKSIPKELKDFPNDMAAQVIAHDWVRFFPNVLGSSEEIQKLAQRIASKNYLSQYGYETASQLNSTEMHDLNKEFTAEELAIIFPQITSQSVKETRQESSSYDRKVILPPGLDFTDTYNLDSDAPFYTLKEVEADGANFQNFYFGGKYDLSGSKFKEGNFSGAQSSPGANLGFEARGSDWSNAELDAPNLNGWNISWGKSKKTDSKEGPITNFKIINLSGKHGVDFSRTHIEGGQIDGNIQEEELPVLELNANNATLHKIAFRNLNLRGSDFRSADLGDVQVLGKQAMPNAMRAGDKNSTFSNVLFPDLNLVDANLTDCSFDPLCDDFRGAKIIGAKMGNVKIDSLPNIREVQLDSYEPQDHPLHGVLWSNDTTLPNEIKKHLELVGIKYIKHQPKHGQPTYVRADTSKQGNTNTRMNYNQASREINDIN